MWPPIEKYIARYYAYRARCHYQHQRYQLCLQHLHTLTQWDHLFLSNPMYAGYLAICHLKLSNGKNVTQEVETALFLLRRFIDSDKEALILWQDLKGHLADLRYVTKQGCKLETQSASQH